LFKGNKAGSGDSENDVSNKRFEPKSSLLKLYLLILRDARESSGYKDERSQLFGYSVAAERYALYANRFVSFCCAVGPWRLSAREGSAADGAAEWIQRAHPAIVNATKGQWRRQPKIDLNKLR